MNLVIIAAIGKNNELGKDNKLIWHLPGDLRFFKEKTIGKDIVMGRRTYESLPGMLPKRRHIVITRGVIGDANISVYHSVEEFLNNYESDEETFIIGGGEVYRQFLSYASAMYLTEIDDECKSADVYFPEFDKSDWIREELMSNKENGVSYKHVLYRRK